METIVQTNKICNLLYLKFDKFRKYDIFSNYCCFFY